MEKKLRKILIIAMIVIMGLGTLVVMSGCNNYVFSEDDFKLTIYVNDNQVNANDIIEANIGDEIEVRATLTNISGRVAQIEFVERAGTFGMIENNDVHITILPTYNKVSDTDLQVPSHRISLEKNASFSRFLQYQITEVPQFFHPPNDQPNLPFDGEYTISARATFYAGRNKIEPIILRINIKMLTK